MILEQQNIEPSCICIVLFAPHLHGLVRVERPKLDDPDTRILACEVIGPSTRERGRHKVALTSRVSGVGASLSQDALDEERKEKREKKNTR
jgi:hypothetical protein